MTRREVLEKWAAIAAERLKKAAPVDTAGLQSSIKANSQSDSKAIISFLIHGKFRDQNVSRGKKYGDAEKLSGKKGRAAKHWYSKTMRREMFMLSLSLSNNAGEVLLASFNNILPHKIEL